MFFLEKLNLFLISVKNFSIFRMSKSMPSNLVMFLRNSNIIQRFNKHLSTESAENDLRIEYLKSTFEIFNKPNHCELVASKNRNILSLKQASVLVPLTIKIEKNDEKNYVQKMFYTFSKRTEIMDSFKGQVCFVGGKKDPNDKSAMETAYREANEEINIEPMQLTFLAQLCPILTSNGILINPIISYFDKCNYKPILNKNEVDMIFELPTERFLSKEGHHHKLFKNGKSEYYIHYFEDIINEKKITTWGATALLSIIISSILHSRIPEFSVDPQMELTNNNIDKYLEYYLLVKSESLINSTANKFRKN
jgi:8-oxo-dGTP pyrophosphatase MutT (NUDIX family)